MNRGRLCTSISSESVEGMSGKAERALKLGSDMVEFRIDHLEDPSPQEIVDGLSAFSDRCVLTVRARDQGGGFRGDDEERVELLADICGMMKPAFVDVEFETAKRFERLIRRLRRDAGEMILSWHDFEGTPASVQLLKRYSEMRRSTTTTTTTKGIVKMVTFANAQEDNMRVLSLYGRRAGSDKRKLVAFCMGEKGMFSRVLSFYAGSPIVYSALPGESVAPGQLSIAEMRELVSIIG